ncbi:hypothetical protein C7212DRAFT_364588 [Tuber magnatum]|uniref:Uncharacterized protein n=1 Tax=Tuber magnatum TaxID=42249 RepID=A0A317SMA7_9PEZI|nr:hypothetical protein C7212DRAFT_364588 [Tuber magnatum]
MPLAALPSEFPSESSAQAPLTELDSLPSSPLPRSPASIANSTTSTLSQSPSNTSCPSAGAFNPSLRRTNHIMDPINVLSDPHESNPLATGTPTSSTADAAYKLQQLLKASTADGVPDQSPELLDDVGSVHSTGSSLKFAKGIVSGFFRGNKTMATVPDKASSPSGESYHSLHELGALEQQTEGTVSIPGPNRRRFSPRGLFQKPGMTPPKAKAQDPPPIERPTDTSITPDPDQEGLSSDDEQESFSVLSLVRRSREKKALVQALMNTSNPSSASVVTQIHTPLDGGEDRSPSSDNEHSTSPSVLTPAKPRPKNEVVSRDSVGPDEGQSENTPMDIEAAFSRKQGQTESIRSCRSTFSIPARGIIGQGSTSSVLDKTPLAKDTREFHSNRGRKSGVDALTSALTSPTYRRKITSLTPPDDYKLPNLPGYVSFPPYIPSSGLAMLFGNGEETWKSLKRFPSFRSKKGMNVVEEAVETNPGGTVEVESTTEVGGGKTKTIDNKEGSGAGSSRPNLLTL